ncbi:voltage-gated purine nucleotide uniporter SLC17A9-like [Aplochiton taeniatus]
MTYFLMVVFERIQDDEPSLARIWTIVLVLSTCLLYWARMALPISAVAMAREYGWSKTESGLALGGFFWGYCFTQILGGHASDRLGGEWVLWFSTICWGAITLAMPLLAQLGPSPLISVTIGRFLLGLFQGVHYPSLASLCSQRVVEGDRGFLMSTLSTGCYLGTLMAGGLGSLMLEWYGWESVFYSTGLLCGLWVLMVWMFVPIGQAVQTQMPSSHGFSFSLSNMSWLSLLRKPSVGAMVFAHLCYNSTFYALMSWMPTFFKDKFPHTKAWVYNTTPWMVAIPFALLGGFVSDYLIKQVFSHFQFLAMGVSSVFILLLCNIVTFSSAVASMSLAIGFSTFTSSGVSVNVQDLAPSCAGALYGFMNMCGAFVGLVLVYISGYMIEVTTSWNMFFSLITLVNVLGVGVFLLFADDHRVDLEQYTVIHV